MILKRLRRPQLLFFLLVAFGVLWLLWLARGPLTPFIIGLVAAYLLLPLVHRLQAWMPEAVQERKLARPLSVAVVYLLGFAFFFVATNTIVTPLVEQASALANRSDEIYAQAVETVDRMLERYQNEIPLELQERIAEELQAFQPTSLLDALFASLRTALTTIGNTVGFILGLLIVPFWLFFVLNDEGGIVAGMMGMIPAELRGDVEAIRIVMERIFASYVRGQLIVATVLGTMLTIGMIVLGIPFALVLGFVAAVVALVPVLGAFLGAIPAVIIAFFQAPIQALWVVILFVIVQQIDNIFVSPRVTGAAVSLPPAMIMVLIVLGSALFGPLGPIIVVPLAAILRDVAFYLYKRLADVPPSPAEALIDVGYTPSPRLMVTEAEAPVIV